MSNAEENQAAHQPAFDRKQLVKFAVELGPLIVFFLTNARAGIFWGTATFMAATLISLAVSRALLGKIPVMPLITAAFVLVFGGLTLYLQNDQFIKMKPTIVNAMFATVLFGGLWSGRILLKTVFGDIMHLTEQGWQKLTFRWGIFFIVLAVLNEIIWRSFSTDTWVSFKVFGIMPLTMVFAVSQMSLLKRYEQQH